MNDRAHRSGWLLVAAVTACCVMVTGAWGTWTVMARQRTTGISALSGRMTALVIDAGSADVRVAPAASGRISLRETEGWSLRRPVVATHWIGSTLYVAVSCPQPWGLPASAGFGCDVRLDMAVPRDIAVSATAGSGSVAVQGVTGPVDAAAGSGEVTLDGLSGPLRARVGSGTVSAVRLTSSEVAASADSGSVELGFRAAPHRLTVHVGSGSATVRLPPGTRYSVRSTSGSGSVDVDPALVSDASPDSITAAAGAGSLDVGYGD